MPETLHVAIVDDHPLFREGVAHTLAAQPDIEIVGEGNRRLTPSALPANGYRMSCCLTCQCPAAVERGAGDCGRVPRD